MISTLWVAIDTDWGAVREAALTEQARLIGESLIKHYILPFEIGAVLLTAALVGRDCAGATGRRGRGGTCVVVAGRTGRRRVGRSG